MTGPAGMHSNSPCPRGVLQNIFGKCFASRPRADRGKGQRDALPVFFAAPSPSQHLLVQTLNVRALDMRMKAALSSAQGKGPKPPSNCLPSLDNFPSQWEAQGRPCEVVELVVRSGPKYTSTSVLYTVQDDLGETGFNAGSFRQSLLQILLLHEPQVWRWLPQT